MIFMTTYTICLATDSGVVIAQRDNDWRVVRRGLKGQYVTSVVALKGAILAGTTDGIFRSKDDGATWHDASAGLSQRHIRWLAFRPGNPDFVYAGAEPAAIFVSQDSAKSWQEAAEVAWLRDQYHWFLPYSSEAGCVRGFAFNGARGYAAVEVGGVLRSDDRGIHWQLAEGSDGNPDLVGQSAPLIYPDVHSIQVHPTSPDRVFAPTGGGFYRSFDGGKTWRLLYNCYCRAAWIDPTDPTHIILGPADNVETNGRIEETRDGGDTWRQASGGLTVPWTRHLVERFTQIGTDLFAVLSNGTLITASLATLEWREILVDITGVNGISALEPEPVGS
jgi:photosystem II stability/assembly factor-like uncharacterized protein